MARKLFFTLFLILCCLPSSSSFAAEKAAYQVLGVKSDASAEKIDSIYKNLKNPSMQQSAAYGILSDAEMRKQYDASSIDDAELTIPSEDRESLAQMAEPINSAWAQKIRAVGKLSSDTLFGMMSFYIATGAVELAHCYKNSDPSSCVSYIDNLKNKSEYAGLAAFTLAAQGTTAAGRKALGELVASQAGMLVGSLVNNVITAVANSPHMQEYLDAKKIKDPALREKAEKEALKGIYGDTFGSKEWLMDQVPASASLVSASLLSMATVKGVNIASAKIAKGKNFCPTMMAGIAKATQTATAEETAARGFFGNRAHEIGNLFLFLAWSKVLNTPIQPAWEYITVDASMKKSRKDLLSIDGNVSAEKLAAALDAEEKASDDYRRRKMGSAEQNMQPHYRNLQLLNDQINKPYLFYSWFVDGFSDSGWSGIRDSYYLPDTTQKDAEQEIKFYLKSFFCGTDSTKAMHLEKDLHGIPVPGSLRDSIEVYGVATPKDPKLCSSDLSIDDYKKIFSQDDYLTELTTAHANVQVAALQPKAKEIALYMDNNSASIAAVLKEKVLPNFQEELDDLNRLKNSLMDDKSKALVQAKIDETKSKFNAANTVFVYMNTPADKRVLPTQNVVAMLGLKKDNEKKDWEKVVDYYNQFILR